MGVTADRDRPAAFAALGALALVLFYLRPQSGDGTALGVALLVVSLALNATAGYLVARRARTTLGG
ncbi:hypothetical protein [Haloarchaeobius baliensis]|uniref:hypothetical protein n=1 Tax=Haloarchaeobius baliensis TaxID=1670458 RepID=UPI003F88062D